MSGMLAGRHVTLRPVRPSDYPDILRWQNDPEVFYWMDYERPFTLEDIEASELRATEEGHPFIVEVDGRGVGRIGLNNFRPRDRMASLYIFIGERDLWGRRIGLDALLTLLDFGFEWLELRRIELWMLEGNARAGAMYKSAGFIEEATLPDRSLHDGVYLGHVYMSVDKEGFERARAAFDVS